MVNSFLHSICYLILLKGCLIVKFSKSIQEVYEQHPDEKWLNSTEIMAKFPALENIPEDHIGLLSEDCGIVRVKKALGAFRELSEKLGAELLYNTEVAEVSKSRIKLASGIEYEAKHVVVCTGPYTAATFDKSSNVTKLDVEYYLFDDPQGLPPGMVEYTSDGGHFYSCTDGEDLKHYKVGDFKKRNMAAMMKYLKVRMPSKVKALCGRHDCYFSVVDSGEFQYKTDENGIHYAYGFSGTGFKFMPLHGKIVCDGLIKKEFMTYIPSKFRAKM